MLAFDLRVCLLLGEGGEQHIPCDDQRNAGNAENEKEQGRGDKENILQFIFSPAPMLELQGKHGNLADQQPTAYKDHDDDGNRHPRITFQQTGGTHHDTSPEECIGRCGQSDEAHGLTFVKIEFGQS